MSGEPEIRKWVDDNLIIVRTDTLEENYNRIAKEFEESGNRLPLDEILLDQKPQFLEWIESQLITPSSQLEPPEAIEKGFIKIRAFSYIRNGKVVNVPSHQRRKRK